MTAKKEQLFINLEKIDRFPVGRAFSLKSGSEVRYGWVTGYALNGSTELVFKVRWADTDRETLLNPVDVHHVLTFVDYE